MILGRGSGELKITSVSVWPDTGRSHGAVFVVCDDGSLWISVLDNRSRQLEEFVWEQVPGPKEEVDTSGPPLEEVPPP